MLDEFPVLARLLIATERSLQWRDDLPGELHHHVAEYARRVLPPRPGMTFLPLQTRPTEEV